MISTVHTFWTAPCGGRPQMTPAEKLCMALSALLLKHHFGNVTLFTDRAGEHFVTQNGFALAYDKIDTSLDTLAGIDPKRFWALGKLWGLLHTPAPCLALDNDALLWSAVTLFGTITGSHLEAPSWNCYRNNERDFSGYGFRNGWDWSQSALNCGVLGFKSEDFKQAFATTALSFAERYSSTPPAADPAGLMMFAEQRLAGLLAARHGHRPALIAKLRARLPLIEPGPRFCHLWSAKDILRRSAPLQETTFAYLAAQLESRFPKSAWMLDMLRGEASGSIAPDDPDGPFVKTIGEVHGGVYAMHPALITFRKVLEGDKLFWGETITGTGQCLVLENGKQVYVHPGHAGVLKPRYDSDVIWANSPTNLGSL